MEEQFMVLANEIHNANEKKRFEKWRAFVRDGEEIYLFFKLWCYRNRMDNSIKDKSTFERYLKNKKIEITDEQRANLYKKYFDEKGERRK